MISQIGPLVQGGSNVRLLGTLHILGGSAGGVVAGILLGAVSVMLHSMWPEEQGLFRMVGYPLLLIVLASGDLGVIPPLYAGPHRQTPGTWACSLGPKGAVTAWGFDLGLGLTTFAPTQLMLALPAYALVSGSVTVALVVMTAYGAGRAIAVSASLLLARRDYAEVCTLYNRLGLPTKWIIAAAAIALAVAALLVWVGS